MVQRSVEEGLHSNLKFYSKGMMVFSRGFVQEKKTQAILMPIKSKGCCVMDWWQWNAQDSFQESWGGGGPHEERSRPNPGQAVKKLGWKIRRMRHRKSKVEWSKGRRPTL